MSFHLVHSLLLKFAFQVMTNDVVVVVHIDRQPFVRLFPLVLVLFQH